MEVPVSQLVVYERVGEDAIRSAHIVYNSNKGRSPEEQLSVMPGNEPGIRRISYKEFAENFSDSHPWLVEDVRNILNHATVEEKKNRVKMEAVTEPEKKGKPKKKTTFLIISMVNEE